MKGLNKEQEFKKIEKQLEIEKRELRELENLKENPPFFLMFYSKNN